MDAQVSSNFYNGLFLWYFSLDHGSINYGLYLQDS